MVKYNKKNLNDKNVIKSNNFVKENSKLRKKIKFTSKKLVIDKVKLKKGLILIKQQNDDLRKQSGLTFDNNIYINIILKSKSEDKVKNKALHLPFNLINDKKILIICDKESKKDTLILNSVENMNYVEVMSYNEFKELLNKTKNKSNLNFIYHMIISDQIYLQKFKNILRDDFNKLDFNFYNKSIEITKEYIGSMKDSSIVRNIDNRLFIIKTANTSQENNIIFKNILKISNKVVSYILSSSQKHNSIKTLIIKSDNSIPFTIFGDMDVDDIVYFE